MFDWPLVEEPKKTEDFVIRFSHKWVLKPFNCCNGKIYQPELAIWISEPSTVRLSWVSLPKKTCKLEKKKSRTARWNVASCFQLRPSAMLELLGSMGDSNNQLAKPTGEYPAIWMFSAGLPARCPKKCGNPTRNCKYVWMLYTYTHFFYITLVWYTTVELGLI